MATTAPTTPHNATRASLSQLKAGAGTSGLSVSWKLSTNGLSGKMSPTVSSHLGGSSSGMNTLETNASGRIVALATAEAERAFGTSPATASPSAEKLHTPTTNVTTIAGTLAASISRSYASTPIVSI